MLCKHAITRKCYDNKHVKAGIEISESMYYLYINKQLIYGNTNIFDTIL